MQDPKQLTALHVTKMTTNERIFSLMKERNWTPKYLAKIIDAPLPTVNKWFLEDREKRSYPKVNQMAKILDVMGLSPFEFLAGFHLPDLTEDQNNLIAEWSKLDPQEKESLLMLIKNYNKNRD